MKTSTTIACAALVAATLGCEGPALPSGPQTAAPPAAETPAEAPIMVAGAPGEALPEIETPVTNTPRPFNSHDPIKGRRSRRAGGAMGAAAGARFHAEYQMLINNVNHAHQLYWAEKGDWAQSHEEFIKNIVEYNKLVLPDLEPIHEYIYVPEQPEVGLQIRLKQPESAVAAPADPAAQPATDPATAEVTPPAGPAEQPAEELDPRQSPNIRERAAAIGGPALDVE